MTKNEYQKIQNDLDHLIENIKFKSLNQNERDVYKRAVLACKSVVSNFSPKDS